MTEDKQYLVTTRYGDGSGGRKVLTLAGIQEKFTRAPMPGSTITIEEL